MTITSGQITKLDEVTAEQALAAQARALYGPPVIAQAVKDEYDRLTAIITGPNPPDPATSALVGLELL